MAEAPWILLTLRRTGGTSLMAFLQSISRFPAVQHEPFNPDRVFGWITKGFRETLDEAWLAAQIDGVLAERPNLKHCLDVARPELTRVLIDTCQRKGYRFLLLTRRDEAARLASLYLAFATGVWGAAQAREIYPQIIAGTRKADPIDPSEVETQVKTDFYSLGRTLTCLRNRQINYPWLVFEELYHGTEPVQAQALRLAEGLGHQIADDDPRLAVFGKEGSQRSGDIGQYVPGYEATLARLKQLCRG